MILKLLLSSLLRGAGAHTEMMKGSSVFLGSPMEMLLTFAVCG